MDISNMVSKALKDPKCHSGNKDNDDWFLANCWAQEIPEKPDSPFERNQQRIYRFLQAHSLCETLFRKRRDIESKVSISEPLTEINNALPSSPNTEMLPLWETAREYIKELKEQLK